jgi:mRNA-degrading endonuclease RelE of RelBE toxin-antitoxin system
MGYEVLMSQTFQDQWRLLPPAQVPRIRSKIETLVENPRAASNNTTQLKGIADPPRFRLRIGHWRVVYWYSSDTVWLDRVGPRASVYRQLESGNDAGGKDWTAFTVPDDAPEVGDDVAPVFEQYRRGMRTWFEVRDVEGAESAAEAVQAAEPSEPTPLPGRITHDLLRRIRIPRRFHRTLAACHTDLDLLRAMTAGVPAEVVDRVFNVMVDSDHAGEAPQQFRQLKQIEDLTRFHNGDLIDFQVALDPEQRQIARAILASDGPILISGAAGTGKSTILLDAAIGLAQSDEWQGQHPRILICTYTRALEQVIKDQIRRIAPTVKYIDVRTFDSLVGSVRARAGETEDIASDTDLMVVLRRIAPDVLRRQELQLSLNLDESLNRPNNGNLIGIPPLAGMTWDYLLTEIESVVIGRCTDDPDDYLTLERRGRRVRLGDAQRRAVWDISVAYRNELARQTRKLSHSDSNPYFHDAKATGWTSWEQARRIAADVVTEGKVDLGYDAVFVDEAQDLSPNAIRLLMELHLSRRSKPKHFYLAADGNQTIYGHTVSWVSIHPKLQLQGRTRRLRKNHRTTRQIAEAALAVLHGAELESDSTEIEHLNTGPRPEVVYCPSEQSEVASIIEFFNKSCAEIGRGIEHCAVLVPEDKHGHRMQQCLELCGVAARFAKREEVKLGFEGVKVLTRHTAKGMEFPIVAIAMRQLIMRKSAPQDEAEERELQVRRILHMSMTRAMRSLLVTLPATPRDPVLATIEEPLWRVRGDDDTSSSKDA